jgi:hypothetical protein
MDKLNTDVRFSIVPQWLLETETSDRAIRVYALIAGYADSETLTAFPSRETLAKRANCHVKTIDRAIAELVEIGALTKQQRKNGDEYSSNLYTIRRVPPQMSPPRDTGVAGVGTPVGLPRDTDVPLTRTTELEPVNKNQLTNEFEIFWSIYPRRTGKQAAKASFEKAVKAVGLDKVMDGVRALSNDPNLPEEKFIPNPATWLNQGRWDDDPYPAKHSDRKPTAAERTAQLIHGARARDEQELITKGIGQGPDFGGMLKGIEG